MLLLKPAYEPIFPTARALPAKPPSHSQPGSRWKSAHSCKAGWQDPGSQLLSLAGSLLWVSTEEFEPWPQSSYGKPKSSSLTAMPAAEHSGWLCVRQGGNEDLSSPCPGATQLCFQRWSGLFIQIRAEVSQRQGGE